MIKSLKIEGYRGFKEYELEGLSRVNLLTGMNNSGKSSILECLTFLNSDIPVTAFHDISRLRKESHAFAISGTESGVSIDIDFPPILNFFYQFELIQNQGFSIKAEVAETEKVKYFLETSSILNGNPIDAKGVAEQERVTDGIPLFHKGNYLLFTNKKNNSSGEYSEQYVCFILFHQDTHVDYLNRSHSLPSSKIESMKSNKGEKRKPSVLLTLSSIPDDRFLDFWGHVVESADEERIINILQMINPEIDGIYYRSGQQGEFLLGINGKRLPLSSQGDGIKRLFAFGLALVHAKGGTLLVDEIDTGLHYTVLDDMWKIILKTAKELNVQVFATTHSQDCIRSLGVALSRNPEFQSDASIQLIDHPRLDKAVCTPGEEIPFVVDHEIEVR